ncbi:MAG: translocation/assembly module TamB domain-containing protein [Geminocystis sp.]|nr:translocation/assembly module TamB domain-containing protein [Geminocystis sp.]
MLSTRENPFASSSDKQLVIVSPRDIVFTPSDKQTLPVSPTTYFLDKSSLSSVAKKGNITASSDKQSASVSNPDRISNGGNNPSLLSTYPSTVNDSSVSWDKNNQSVLLSPPTTSVLSYSSTNNNNYFFPLVFPPSDKPSASSSTYLFGNLTIPPATLNTTTSNFWDNQSVLVSSSENVITPSNSYGGSGNRWESILVFPPTTLTTSLANQSVFASSPHNNSPPHPLVLVSNTGNVTTLADDSAIVNTTLFSKNNSESLLLSLPTKETEDKSLILSSTPTDNTRQSFGKATFSSSPPSTTHTSINPDNRYFTVSSSLFSTGNPPISLNKASISSDKSSLSVSSSKTVIIAEKKPSLSASFSKNTITLSDKQPLIIPPPKIAACVVDNQSINSQLKLDNQLASLSPCIDSLATLSPYPLINVFPPHKPSFSPSSPTGEGFVSLGNTSSLKSPFGSQAFVYSDEYLALINDSSSKVAPSDNQSPLVSLYNNQSALVSLPNSKGDNRRLLAFPSFPPNQSKLASVSYPSTVKTITLADSKSAKPSGFPNENLLASVSPLSTAKKPSSTLPSPVSVFGLQPSYTTFTPDNQSVLIFPGGNSTFPYNQPSASISITPSFLFSPNKTTIFSNNNLFNGNYGIGVIYASKSDSKSASLFPLSDSIIPSDKPSVGVSFGNNRLITSSTSVSPRKTTDKTTTASDNYSANNNINPLPGNNKIIPLASQWLWRHPDGDMTASSNSHSKSVSVFPLDNSNTPLPPPPPTNPTTSDNPVMSLFYPSLLGITDKTTIPLEKLLVIPPNRLTIPYSGKNPTILSLSELFDSQPPLVSPPNPDNQSALASSFFKIILTPENQQLLVSYYKNKTTPQNPLAAGLSTYGSSNGNSNGNGNSSQTTNNQAATISSLFLPPYNSSIKSSLSSGKTIFSPASQSILSRGKQLSFLNNNPTGLSLSQSSITTVTKPPDKTLTVCLLPFLNSTTSCNKPKATISSPSQLPHTITAISGVNPPLFEINTDNQSLFKTFERITQTRRLLETRRKKYSQNNFPPLQQLEGKLGGVVNLDLSRKGLVAKFDFSTSQWQWGKYSGDSIRVAGSYRNGLLTLLPVTINSHGGIISLTGTIGEENISASLVLSDVSLSQWQDLLASTNVRVDGLLNANVVVSGSRKNPLARGSVEVSNFRINGNEMDKTNATFFLKNSRLDFSASSNLTTPSESLRIFGGFPFQLFPQSVKPETDAFFMDLALNRDGFNLLNVITNNQLNWLAGDGKVTVKIHGNYNQTRNEITFLVAEGIATVENGIVGGSWLANSVIDNIHGKILFDLNRLTIPLFTASFNGSKIAVNGSLPFVSPSDANNSLLVAVGDVNVNLNHLYSGNANALVNIHGSLLFPKIGGQINLAKGIIWVGDDSSKVWQNRGNNRLFNRVKLENLFLTLGEGISVVKPPLIDLKVAGNIVLNGEFGNLKPEGVVRLTGGSVNLFTSRLSLAKDYNHIAKFTPENGFNPYVDLLLEGRIFESSRHQFLDKSNPQEIDDSPYFYIDTGEFVRIRAHLNGWLNNNRDIPLYFSSSPRRSQGEILALLGGGFFGNPSPTDTSLSIAGLASTALFTGIHGEIQNSTGFDSLRFFPTRISSSDNRTSLGLGAELAFDFTDSLSFSAIRILTSPLPTRYNLRYRLSPIFSLRTSSDFQRHFLLLLEASSRF